MREKAKDEDWLAVEKEINRTKNLITKNMKSVDDLVITLHLYSSYWCMMTKRLISADNDLKDALDTFNKRKKPNIENRPNIPIVPCFILLQRIYLQRGLLLQCYGKKIKAFIIFTKLLKIGKIYDPVTRMEALKHIGLILNDPKYAYLHNRPETK
jgi:hypothetical protein